MTDAYNKLAYYTLAHKDPAFIHQYIVDAFTAQNADQNTKPIAIVFALIGLYLHVEKNFTGKEVQLAHMRLAKYKKFWPSISLPKFRGEITAEDILKISPGPERDKKIDDWCTSMWRAYASARETVINLFDTSE